MSYLQKYMGVLVLVILLSPTPIDASEIYLTSAEVYRDEDAEPDEKPSGSGKHVPGG